MLEFKVIQELKPNTEILEIIKSYSYIIKNGKVKHLLKTNLQFVVDTKIIETVFFDIVLLFSLFPLILKTTIKIKDNKFFYN